MSLREKFGEIVREIIDAEKPKYGCADQDVAVRIFLTAVCEEEGHRLKKEKGLWACRRCGWQRETPGAQ